MVRNYRKPLICASPKTLLRLPAAVSTLEEMASGTTFHSVLPSTTTDRPKVTRIIFVCGKHYYTLAKEVETKILNNIALIRIEVSILCVDSFNINKCIRAHTISVAQMCNYNLISNLGVVSIPN